MTDNYRDVGEFHRRFHLAHANDKTAPRLIDHALVEYRLRFLHEELEELEEGYTKRDLAKIADALVDLVYVALGTAHLHGLPWQALWREVQRANMTKERCEGDHPWVTCPVGGVCAEWCPGPSCCHRCDAPRHKHSLRGNVNDVIKPPGWRPPRVHEVLLAAGWPGAAVAHAIIERTENA